MLRIDKTELPITRQANLVTNLKVTANSISNDETTAVDLSGAGLLMFNRYSLPLPRFELIEDLTDTWSHNADRYTGKSSFVDRPDAPVVIDSGSVMASMGWSGALGDASRVNVEFRVYDGAPSIDILIHINWCERFKILKLNFSLPTGAIARYDGIMSGELARPLDGKEFPLSNFVRVVMADGMQLAVVCPDLYALDCTSGNLRLTLLRGPLMAHHDPHPARSARAKTSDQGEHAFRLRIFCAPSITLQQLEFHSFSLQRPLAFADLTRGMKAH